MNDQLLDDTYQQTYEGTVKNGLTVREGWPRRRKTAAVSEMAPTFIMDGWMDVGSVSSQTFFAFRV